MPLRRPARRQPFAAALGIALTLALPHSAGAQDPVPDLATGAADPPLRRVQEVTATATRGERDVLEIPGHVTVITREDIDRSGARNLPELLRREAGIFVVQDASNPTGYSAEARGFNNGSGSGSSLLLLVDGRRVNEPDSSAIDWALVHLDHVERVEVVRGPTSAVWGDNAVGGVVEVTTRPAEGAPRGTLRGRTGTYGLDGGSLVASGAAGPVGVAVFGEYESADNYRDRSDFRTRDFEGKLRFELGERATATLLAGYSSDERDGPGSLSDDQIRSLGRRAANPGNREDFNDVRRRFFQGVLELVPRDDLRLRFVPYYRRRTNRAIITDATGPGLTRLANETDALGLNSQLQWDADVAGRPARLTAGVDLLREDLDNESFFSGSDFPRRSRRETWGVFLQEEIELTPSLLLTAGVRFDEVRLRLVEGADKTKPDYDLWSPRAGLTWSPREGTSFYAGWARGFRFPNLDETSGVFAANPEIKPQRSNSYEVGFKLRRDRVSANVALYHMDVTDEILLTSEVMSFGFLGVLNVNANRVQHRGAEIGLEVRPLDWLELFGQYTLDDTKIERDSVTNLDGNAVPVTPRHRGTYGVRFLLPQDVEISLHGIATGSRYGRNDFGQRLSKLSKFSVYDAFIAFRPELVGGVELALTATVRNLFSREYAEIGGRRTFVDPVAFAANPQAFFGSFPSADRTYEVGVAVTVRR